MAAAQWAVLFLTAVAAGLTTYLYNDGRDHHVKLMLQASAVIGVLGTALFIAGGVLSTPASSVPQCDWSDLDDDLQPRCESSAEAARRAAGESGDEFVSTYLIGPAYEFGAMLVAGGLGLLVATATRRRPSDGRPRQLLVDNENAEGR